MTILRSRRVVLPDGVRAVDIEIRDGRITAITDSAHAPHVISGVIDAGDLVVLPGLVDSHVHVNEPGRTDWEGFVHATRAAAAGGVTTIVDMPLNSIPATTSVEALDTKRRAAARECHVDVAFWGGVVPGNVDHLEPLAAAGVLGFKCFLCPSGVDEFPHVSEKDLDEVMPVLAALGLPLLVHAEWPGALREPAGDRPQPCDVAREPAGGCRAAGHRSPGAPGRRPRGVDSHRPPRIACGARDDHRCPCARRCHHGGNLSALSDVCGRVDPRGRDHVQVRAPDQDRCRSRRSVARTHGRPDRSRRVGPLSIASGTEMPRHRRLRTGVGRHRVAAGVSVRRVDGRQKRGLGVECLAEWMAAAPARLAGIDAVKGRIAVGCDADLVLFDPAAVWTVDPHQLYHRHALTPYEGMTLTGQVRTTFLRGQIVYDAHAGTGAPRGKLLTGQRARVE